MSCEHYSCYSLVNEISTTVVCIGAKATGTFNEDNGRSTIEGLRKFRKVHGMLFNFTHKAPG